MQTVRYENFEQLNKVTFSDEKAPISVLWVQTRDFSIDDSQQIFYEHHHHFFELHCVFRGELSYTIGGVKTLVKEGEFLLVPAFLQHKVNGYTQNLLKMTVAVTSEYDAVVQALKGFDCKPTAFTTDMVATFDFMKRELPAQNAYSALMIGRAFERAIYELIRANLPTVFIKRTGENDARLVRAIRFIKENPQLFLTCEEIASYCFLSVKQLNRVFLKNEGVTLLEYIHREKVLQMQALLSKTDDTLSEISAALGFSSLYYCSRFFHSHVGVSPNEYRRLRR